jgi:hypothetical protein
MMLVPGNSVMKNAVLENTVLKYVDDNSDETVDDVDGVKNDVVMTIDNGTMLVSGVSVMIILCLEIRF